MKWTFCATGALAVVLLAAPGCKKKSDTIASGSGVSSTSSPATQNAANGSDSNRSTMATQGDSAAARVSYDNQDLAALTRGVRRWVAAHRQVPASFEDFTAKSGINAPPPPAGKKYALSKEMRVILVDKK